jgi:hypothetical protein
MTPPTPPPPPAAPTLSASIRSGAVGDDDNESFFSAASGTLMYFAHSVFSDKNRKCSKAACSLFLLPGIQMDLLDRDLDATSNSFLPSFPPNPFLPLPSLPSSLLSRWILLFLSQFGN